MGTWPPLRARPDRDSKHSLGVVDGDTLDLEVELAFRHRHTDRFRLGDVDTAETYGVTRGTAAYREGFEQTIYTRHWIRGAVETGETWPLQIETEKESGKYGRWIARVMCPELDANLNQDLIMAFGVGT